MVSTESVGLEDREGFKGAQLPSPVNHSAGAGPQGKVAGVATVLSYHLLSISSSVGRKAPRPGVLRGVYILSNHSGPVNVCKEATNLGGRGEGREAAGKKLMKSQLILLTPNFTFDSYLFVLLKACC